MLWLEVMSLKSSGHGGSSVLERELKGVRSVLG